MQPISLSHLHDQACHACTLDGTWRLCPDQYDTCLGAGAKAGFHGREEELFIEERQQDFYKYQNRYNRKGLIDEKRRYKKLAYATVT